MSKKKFKRLYGTIRKHYRSPVRVIGQEQDILDLFMRMYDSKFVFESGWSSRERYHAFHLRRMAIAC